MTTSRPLAERLAEKYVVDPATGCWRWTASVNRFGYGRIGSGGRRGQILYAHIAAYTLYVGPVPDGKELDHLCHTRDLSCAGGVTCTHRRCVNPQHLEPVTRRQNLQRGARARATHCVNDHPYTEDNTGRNGRGNRYCKTCAATWELTRPPRQRRTRAQRADQSGAA